MTNTNTRSAMEFALVPRDPTEEMIEALHDEIVHGIETGCRSENGRTLYKDVSVLDASSLPCAYRAMLAAAPTLIEAATGEQGVVGREEISDLEGLAILLDGYARDRKRDKLPKTSDVLAAAASHLRAYAAALRPSASTGGDYAKAIEDAAKVAERLSAVVNSNAAAKIATAIRALTPSPVVAEVERAAQEMLVAFAEGVEWTDEKRAAYDALSAALSVVPEVAK